MNFLKFLFPILQWGIIMVILYVYNHIFKVPKLYLSLSISYYYYCFIILPIIILLWNVIYWRYDNFIVKLSIFVGLYFILILYWINSIKIYPYRVPFILMVSLCVLLGNYIFSRNKKNINK
jgi:hypothetical protein